MMIKKCEFRKCFNFFTVGRKKKFCSKKCCDKEKKKAWEERNPDFKKSKAYRARTNRYLRKKYRNDAEWRQKVLDREKARVKEYRKNPEWVEKKRVRNKRWREKSKDYYNNYQKERSKNDLDFKMRNNLRSRIRAALKYQSASKDLGTAKLVGCTMLELRAHLERQFKDGMTWDNHGDWHIDHIKPCVSFDLTDPEQQRECFHYTNLQPLWAEDNRRKGATYEP
jgi:hypothetical protein